jgi:uncharacterized protein YbjT (DUF2867 family)
VFLVWTAPPAAVDDVIARIASHTKRVVYLSAPHNVAHPFFQATPDNAMAQLHRHVERALANADMNATILRPGMFMSNALHWWAPSIARGEPVRWPYGGAETAPVDERDVAAVAARVLCDVGHDRTEYIITGSESLSQAAQVRLIGEVLRRRIPFVDVPEEEFRREVAGVWPPAVLDMLLAAWRGTMGEPAYITSDVYDVTGAPPRTFREWVEDNADAFR